MNAFPLPVRVVGPGSQPGDKALNYLCVAADMATFRPPPLPEAADPCALATVRRVLAELIHAMRTQPFGAPVLDLGGLDAAALDLLNRTLGEGEVSVLVRAPRRLEIQETAFAGVWRVRERNAAGGIAAERIEAGAMPAAVAAAMSAMAGPLLRPPAPEGLMNAPALLAEIADRAARQSEGSAPHVINLTLLPMSPQDLAWLATALGEGPVTLLSRGYGNCRITGTRLAQVWRVQYFNSMDQLILDTIEITTVPAAALAAPEDHADSIERLEEWLEMLGEG
ncbi:MAG: hydrogenase expression/formation protein [Caenispirillum sp.]|nr:hydrogenase expression/formation protein [Caenispirillum sp.]